MNGRGHAAIYLIPLPPHHQGGNLIGFFDRLKLGDPPKARTEEEARGGQTDEGERGGEVTQL